MNTEWQTIDYLRQIEQESKNITVNTCHDNKIIDSKLGKKIAEVYRDGEYGLIVYDSNNEDINLISIERLKHSGDYPDKYKLHPNPYITFSKSTGEISSKDPVTNRKHCCYNAISEMNTENKNLNLYYDKFKNIIINFHWDFDDMERVD